MKNIALICLIFILFSCHEYDENAFPPTGDNPVLPETLTVDITKVYIEIKMTFDGSTYKQSSVDWHYVFQYQGREFKLYNLTEASEQGINGTLTSTLPTPLVATPANQVAFSKFTDEQRRTGVQFSEFIPFSATIFIRQSREPNGFKYPALTYGAKNLTLNFDPDKTVIRLIQETTNVSTQTQEFYANRYMDPQHHGIVLDWVNDIPFFANGNTLVFIDEI